MYAIPKKVNHHYAYAFRIALLTYLLICCGMWTFQRYMLYHPKVEKETPANYGLENYQSIWLVSNDTTHVQVWYHRARAGYPTVVYFHGNKGDLGEEAPFFRLLTDSGFGVLGLNYRGFGASEGVPSEEGFYDDARSTMKYALKVLSLNPQHVIIYGESLGTGVAVQMATEYHVAALVLQSPFVSLQARVQAACPWLPVSLLLKDHFDSLSKIAQVHTKLLLIHGEDDDVVPVAEGKTIFEHANEPKEALYFSHRGHDDFDDEQLDETLVAFSHKYHLIDYHSTGYVTPVSGHG